MIHQIWMADTPENADKAFDAFLETYQAKCFKACECLSKDRDELLVSPYRLRVISAADGSLLLDHPPLSQVTAPCPLVLPSCIPSTLRRA